MDLEVARGRLGGLDQIVDQPPQTLRLADQDPGVLGDLLVFARLVADQTRVVHNGCQRGLEIVRDVGDQLRLHPLRAQPVLHGDGHARGDGVQILSALAQIPQHAARVGVVGQIAAGKGLRAGLELAQAQCQPHGPGHQQRLLDKPEQQKLPAACPPHDHKLNQRQNRRRQNGAPHQGDGSHQAADPPAKGLQPPPEQGKDPPSQTQAPRDRGAREQAAVLDPSGRAHRQGQRQHQNHQRGCARGGKAQGVIIVVPGLIGQKQQEIRHHPGCGQHQIEGDLVQRPGAEGFGLRPAGRDRHEPCKAQNRKHQKAQRQGVDPIAQTIAHVDQGPDQPEAVGRKQLLLDRGRDGQRLQGEARLRLFLPAGAGACIFGIERPVLGVQPKQHRIGIVPHRVLVGELGGQRKDGAVVTADLDAEISAAVVVDIGLVDHVAKGPLPAGFLVDQIRRGHAAPHQVLGLLRHRRPKQLAADVGFRPGVKVQPRKGHRACNAQGQARHKDHAQQQQQRLARRGFEPGFHRLPPCSIT